MKLLLLLAMVAITGTAAAQNSDLGLLFGTTSFNAGAASVGGEINYAYQIKNLKGGRLHPRGRLYLELPVFVPVNSQTILFTPGVRYHVNLSDRFVLYGSLGAGPTFQPGQFTSVSAAVILGLGADYRLNRRWSLRGDLRTYGVPFDGILTSAPSVMVGTAIHF